MAGESDFDVEIGLREHGILDTLRDMIAELARSSDFVMDLEEAVNKLNTSLEAGDIDTIKFSRTLMSLETTAKRVQKKLEEQEKIRAKEAAATQEVADKVDKVVAATQAETQAKKDGEPTFERYIRRHRWMQSYLLVTGNFMMKLGNGIKAFGGILQLLTAPMVYFLNVVFAPLIPYIADFSKGMMDIVKAFDDMTEDYPIIKELVGSFFLVVFSAGMIGMIADFATTIWDAALGMGAFSTAAAASPTELAMVEGTVGAGAAGAGGAATGFWAGVGSMSAAAFIGSFVVGLAAGLIVVNMMWSDGTMEAIKRAGKSMEESHPMIMDALRVLFAPMAIFGTMINNLLTGSIKRVVEGVVDAIKSVAGAVFDLIGIMLEPIMDLALGEGAYANIKSLLGGAYDTITSPVVSLFSSLDTLAGNLDWNYMIRSKVYDADLLAALRTKYGDVTYSATKGYTVAGKAIEAFATGGFVTKTGLALVHKNETITPATGTHGTPSSNTQTFIFQGTYKDEYDMFKRFKDLMRKEGMRFST